MEILLRSTPSAARKERAVVVASQCREFIGTNLLVWCRNMFGMKLEGNMGAAGVLHSSVTEAQGKSAKQCLQQALISKQLLLQSSSSWRWLRFSTTP